MRTVFETLAVNIDRLRAELELHDVLAAALKARYEDDIKSLGEYERRARRATYSNTIVGCYGLIEETVDSLLIGTAEAFSLMYSKVGDLPDGLHKEHRKLILECLLDGERARTRGVLDERTALETLRHDQDHTVTLLGVVFSLSTANYRFGYTQGLFNRLSIPISPALSVDRPVEALAKAGFADCNSFLEDLVQRRNDLAHSYGDDDILSPDLLSSYVEIVGAYLRSLITVTNREVVARLTGLRLTALGDVVKTWTGRIGIHVTAGSIRIGDQLLLMKDTWCTSHRIVSLQNNGVDGYEYTFAGVGIDVSAAVSSAPAGAEGAQAFVIGPEWRDYWPTGEKPVLFGALANYEVPRTA